VQASPGIRIEAWHPLGPGTASFDAEVEMLADILRAIVYDGAGVSFVVPYSHEQARAFWVERVWPGVQAGTRHVLIARDGERIVGTVQFDTATPPNQPHRADVTKLLVHPNARRRGVARALMLALEDAAQAAGRTLLTLDTWTDSPAEQLYRSLGYTVLGVIPRFAKGSTTETFEPATFMYKELPTTR